MPARALLGLLLGLVLALCAVLLSSASRAEEFDLRQLTENLDLALGAGRNPTGELVAGFGLGPVALNAQHKEFMGYGRPADNPPARSSLAGIETKVALAEDVAMPVGLSFGLDEWDEGNRNLRLIARHGLQLSQLRLDHRLTVTNRFAVDGTRTRSGAGRLALGFDLLGGRHEGVADYGATPQAQLSNIRLSSQWALDAGAAAVLGVTHRPLKELSEARVGLRQPLGGFTLTSDVAADSAGGYAVGFQMALPLGHAPRRQAWSLSALVASLRAERQPTEIAGSDAYVFDDAG